jgi:hypothetical protein
MQRRESWKNLLDFYPFGNHILLMNLSMVMNPKEIVLSKSKSITSNQKLITNCRGSSWKQFFYICSLCERAQQINM